MVQVWVDETRPLLQGARLTAWELQQECFSQKEIARMALVWSVLLAAPLGYRSGGHVAIGLGDYAYPELGQPTNAELVREVARIARGCGRELATPSEVRDALGVRPRGR